MKFSSSLLFVFLFSLKSYSGIEYPAYIITLSGDTLNGRIQIPVKKGALDLNGVRDKIRFADSSGFKVYMPGDINGFGIKAEEISGDYVNFKIAKKQLFLKRISNGYWQMYDDMNWSYRTITAANPIPGSPSFGHTTVSMKSGDGKDYYILYKNKPVKLERDPESHYLDLKQLKEIFGEHPVILNKLTSELQWFHLKEMIDEYNKSNSVPPDQ